MGKPRHLWWVQAPLGFKRKYHRLAKRSGKYSRYEDMLNHVETLKKEGAENVTVYYTDLTWVEVDLDNLDPSMLD
jgi:hypothetical protein